MSKIAKGIRAKRFQVKEGAHLQLTLETELGERFSMKVKNSSLTGVGAWIDEEQATKLSLEPGKIIPESKLAWEENEVSLGRLVFRSKLQNGKGFVYGFSCVDTKIPLLGSLSKCFDTPIGGEETALDFELSAKKFNLASFMETDHSHVDLFHKCAEYSLLRDDMHKNPLCQYYGVRHSVSGQRVKISLPTTKKPTDYVSFASYDYFGFATDPEVKEAAQKAIEKFGVSATATPPLAGRTSLHEELEHKISKLLRKEACMLFVSGFSANVGTLTCLLGANDIAVADILSHASIHDGLNASRSKLRLFRHNSNKHLQNLLTEHRPAHAGALAITEGLFSMDGDVPNLREFVRVSKEHRARTFLDEVHSFGVMGPTGLGAAERCGVLDDIDIYTGSLSKGFGAGGGFVAASQEVIEWMQGFSRAEVFSSALSPCAVAASLKSIEINQTQPERRQKLLDNIKQFVEGVKDLGYTPKADIESPIQPIVIGNEEILGKMNKVMLEHGVFVNPIVFPAVPVTSCRFRFSISSSHSYADIQLALMALKRAIEIAGFSFEEQLTKAA